MTFFSRLLMSRDWAPRPWRIQRNGLGQSVGICDAAGHPVDFSCGDWVNKAQPCTNPNARLAAAAPEMAEFLRRLVDEPSGDETVWPWQQDARALLAKIQGDS